MSNKVLQNYLPTSVINHCILPYLMPSEDEVKKHYDALREHYLVSVHNSAVTCGWHLSGELTLKNKYEFFWQEEYPNAFNGEGPK